MRAFRALPVLTTLALAPPACSPASAPAATTQASSEPGVELIRPQDMYARIYFLSSDALKGRDTPSPGLEAAGAYLVSEYQQMGLEPGGENDTYYQRFPFSPRQPNGPQSVDPADYPANVIAVLPGSDPALRDEYVVLSAHLDHVGIGRPVNGDSIYNGADDNGSGTAALVEVAEAFASLPQRPRRSIMFLHVTGEEHGLIGSGWFADHPTVPINRIVANVNVDMIGRNSPDSVVVIGKGYSSLGQTVDAVAAEHPELGLTVADDLWPAERFFYRSDHFSFARREVPAVFFFAGVHEDYHEPSDSVDKIDPDKAARVARMIFYTVQELANESGRPEWDPEGLAEVRRLVR